MATQLISAVVGLPVVSGVSALPEPCARFGPDPGQICFEAGCLSGCPLLPVALHLALSLFPLSLSLSTPLLSSLSLSLTPLPLSLLLTSSLSSFSSPLLFSLESGEGGPLVFAFMLITGGGSGCWITEGQGLSWEWAALCCSFQS